MKMTGFVVSIFFITFFLSGCNSNSAFEKNVINGDYDKAITEYNDNLMGNISKENEARSFFSSYIAENYEKYKSGDLSEDKMQRIIDCYIKIDKEINLLNEDLENIANEFSSIQISREYYNDAITAMKNENYKMVIEDLKNVDEADTLNYGYAQEMMSSAQERYFSEIIEESQKLISEDNYKKAYECWIEAYDFLQNYEGYQKKCEEIKDAWIVYAINEAKIAFGEQKDYESAIETLQNITFNDKRIDSEIAYYQEYIPFYLTDLEYAQKASYIKVGTILDVIATDVNKQVYNKDSIFYPSGGSLLSQTAEADEDSYILYYLDAQYTKLTGVIYRPYISISSTQDWTKETVVKIYGDDVLLYEAPNITKSTYDPINVDIEISGVRELKIIMRGVYTEEGGFPGIFERSPKVCLAEVMIQK